MNLFDLIHMPRAPMLTAIATTVLLAQAACGDTADGPPVSEEARDSIAPNMVTGTTGAPGPGTVGTPGTPGATIPDTIDEPRN